MNRPITGLAVNGLTARRFLAIHRACGGDVLRLLEGGVDTASDEKGHFERLAEKHDVSLLEMEAFVHALKGTLNFVEMAETTNDIALLTCFMQGEIILARLRKIEAATATAVA